jgi:hypothetical protein
LDKGFLKHLRDKRNALKIVLVFGMGILLIFIGGKNKGTTQADAESIEERLAEACSGISGVGECTVLVYYGSEGKNESLTIESVIVICEGGDSSEVRLGLTRMLSSFLGIGANRIRVEKMRQ